MAKRNRRKSKTIIYPAGPGRYTELRIICTPQVDAAGNPTGFTTTTTVAIPTPKGGCDDENQG